VIVWNSCVLENLWCRSRMELTSRSLCVPRCPSTAGSKVDDRAQRILVTITKITQTLANGTEFQNFMSVFNPLLQKNEVKYHRFCRQIIVCGWLCWCVCRSIPFSCVKRSFAHLGFPHTYFTLTLACMHTHTHIHTHTRISLLSFTVASSVPV
jgi:hypothetical protein